LEVVVVDSSSFGVDEIEYYLVVAALRNFHRVEGVQNYYHLVSSFVELVEGADVVVVVDHQIVVVVASFVLLQGVE